MSERTTYPNSSGICQCTFRSYDATESDQHYEVWSKPDEGGSTTKSNVTLAEPRISDEKSVLPRVYFAGKIRKYCWRHNIVDGLRNHDWADGFLQQDYFICVGPFFVSCDHGCYHREGQHGGEAGCTKDSDIRREDVAKNCIYALNQADLIFCYVDSLDCYGTLFELGRAVERNIPIVIALAPGLASPEKNQFWFMCEFATAVYFDVSEAKLGELFDWIIGRRQW